MNESPGARFGLEWISIAALLGLVTWGVSAWSWSATVTPRIGYSAAVVSAGGVAPIVPDPAGVAQARVSPAIAASEPLAARVDPDWLKRVGAATGIPHRALAAYAGAALAWLRRNHSVTSVGTPSRPSGTSSPTTDGTVGPS